MFYARSKTKSIVNVNVKINIHLVYAPTGLKKKTDKKK